jgi:hypothetical protein
MFFCFFLGGKINKKIISNGRLCCCNLGSIAG